MAARPVRGDAGGMTSPTWQSEDAATPSVLCGVDGSADARVALRVAAGLAEQLGLRLVVAHVAPVPVSPVAFGAGGPALAAYPSPAAGIESGERMLGLLLEEAAIDGAEQRVVAGFPPDRLADLADEENAALLVVGSRGRGSVKAAFLGSVSMDLIGVARCPVLVVPPRIAAPIPPGAAATARTG